MVSVLFKQIALYQRAQKLVAVDPADQGSGILVAGDVRRIAADQIANRHTDGDGSVAVAEIPVVIHLKTGTHGVAFDGKGVDDTLSSLNGIAQVFVEAVGVDAFAGDGTVEAA